MTTEAAEAPLALEDGVLQWKERSDGHWYAEAHGTRYQVVPDRKGHFHTWVFEHEHWMTLGKHPTLGQAFGAARRHVDKAKAAEPVPAAEKGDLVWVEREGHPHAVGRKGHFTIKTVAGKQHPYLLNLDGHAIDGYENIEQAKKVANHLNTSHEAPFAGERVPVIYEAGAEGAPIPAAKEGLQVVERDEKLARAGRAKGQIKTAKDVYNVLHPTLVKQSVEVFVVVPLDIHGRPLTPTGVEIARGPIDQVQVDPAEVLRPVVAMGGKGFVCAHNHPSGAGKASPADVALTKSINKAAKALDRVCLDHVVIGDGSYESIREAYGKEAGF